VVGSLLRGAPPQRLAHSDNGPTVAVSVGLLKGWYMSVFGLNFCRQIIPRHIAKPFPRTVRLPGLGRAWLEGVATTESEHRHMLAQAYDGRRVLHTETRTVEGIGTCYGIYFY
jgi:hypothetical protein